MAACVLRGRCELLQSELTKGFQDMVPPEMCRAKVAGAGPGAGLLADLSAIELDLMLNGSPEIDLADMRRNTVYRMCSASDKARGGRQWLCGTA